jgi:hypothetical protein
MPEAQSLHAATCAAAQLIDGLARHYQADPVDAYEISRGIFLLVGGLRLAPAPAGISRMELIRAGQESLGDHLAACPLHPDLAEAWSP